MPYVLVVDLVVSYGYIFKFSKGIVFFNKKINWPNCTKWMSWNLRKLSFLKKGTGMYLIFGHVYSSNYTFSKNYNSMKISFIVDPQTRL